MYGVLTCVCNLSMKVLILTVLAGGGHYSAGRSVKAKLEEADPNIEIKTIMSYLFT